VRRKLTLDECVACIWEFFGETNIADLILAGEEVIRVVRAKKGVFPMLATLV